MSRLTPAATARSDWPERGLSQAAARPQTRAARQFQTSTTCHALRVGTTRAPSVHRRIPKRQRAGALQDASRSPGPFRISARFWTAAALRRFSPSRPSQTEFGKKANTKAEFGMKYNPQITLIAQIFLPSASSAKSADKTSHSECRSSGREFRSI
jgi:hypothetical protein